MINKSNRLKNSSERSWTKMSFSSFLTKLLQDSIRRDRSCFWHKSNFLSQHRRSNIDNLFSIKNFFLLLLLLLLLFLPSKNVWCSSQQFALRKLNWVSGQNLWQEKAITVKSYSLTYTRADKTDWLWNSNNFTARVIYNL